MQTLEKKKNRYLGLTEAQVQNQCLSYLAARRIFHWRQNTGAAKLNGQLVRYGEPGISDIIGMLPNGRFLAIEVKREIGGRVSEAQKEFLARVNENGGVGIVVTSLNDLIDKLEEVL